MNDYTAEVAELEAAYQANRVANASITTEIRGKYRTIIAAEIEARKRENDYKFAAHLASVKSRSGMPLGVIQDAVLHTKSWDRWTYWRDLAQIEPERIVVQNRKLENARANSAFVWEYDKLTFVVRKTPDGKTLDTPIVVLAELPWRTAEYSVSLVEAQGVDKYAFRKFVTAEVVRAAEAGEIGESDAV